MNRRSRFLMMAFCILLLTSFGLTSAPGTPGATAQAQQRARRGHTNGVTGLVFSPDGATLATVGRDSVISLSNVATAQERMLLRGHEQPIRAVAFSPDGRTLASAGEDSKIFLWDTTTGKLLRILSGHKSFINSIAFSPDGKTIVSGSDDSRIMEWDTATNRPRRTLRGHAGAVTDVTFSPDGTTLASSSKDKTVKLWNEATGAERRALRGHTDAVTSVAFGPGGTNLVTASNDRTVKVWNTATGARQRDLSGQAKGVNSVAFSPNGQLVAGGSEDDSIDLWEVSTGRMQRALRRHTKGVTAVSFSPDSKTLATGSKDETVILWDVATGTPRVVQSLPLSAAQNNVVASMAQQALLTTVNAIQPATAAAAAAAAAPEDGPGGPILVITSSSNKFNTYYAEILRNEGLNEFGVADIGAVSAATLTGYDLVILGQMALSAAQVTMFSNWVNAGGNLIAIRPDKQLAALLGLTDTNTTLTNGYLLVNTAQAPGNGIVNQTMQFHNAADRYSLSGATSVATLYSNASTATANPAVSVRSVGSSGGQAAAFTYDLARSIVSMRQGNPAWAGQERDGFTPIRPDDIFYGDASFDPQPDWIDFNKIAIPQADEQQRLLANMIIQMNLDKKPLPRFWYLPFGKKAAVLMSGDDHGNGGTAGRFDQFIDASPVGCVLANWECVRGTSYIYPNTPFTNAQATAYAAQGFEVGIHINTDCADYTPTSLQNFYVQQMSSWSAKYTGVPAPKTQRHHCIVWSDWLTGAKVQLNHGMRLDTSYYYWPPNWAQDRPGLFNATAMPMRLVDTDGTMIDVYEAVTQMTDESGQSYPFTINTLLDRAVGSEGYYGVYNVNAHTDVTQSSEADAVVASAQARGVPIVTAQQILTWIDARNSSTFSALSWNSGTLNFTLTPGANANGLQAMLPTSSPSGILTELTRGGSPVAYTSQIIKGVEYAVFTASTGSYAATYAVDTTAPTITATTPANGATGVIAGTTASATFSEALDPTTVNGSTFELRGPGSALVSASVTYNAATRAAVLTPATSLAFATAYTAQVKGGVSGIKDLAGNALAADLTWSFTTAAAPACPCSIWGSSDTPNTPSVNDPNAVEIGVRFQSDLAGQITGIRFYKGTGNTGTHIGNLWNSSGQQLATATFSNESATGWQQVTFTNPVAITANTVYVASYHTDAGNYAFDSGFFAAAGVDNAPLHALRDGVSGGNGMYRYGTTGFPDQTYSSTNYWVDVVFAAGSVADTTPPTVTATTPTSGATGVATGSSVTATFSEALNAATVSGTTFQLTGPGNTLVPATVTYSAANTTATLVPNAALATNTIYTAKIVSGASGVKDVAGNALAADFSWTFTTAAAADTTPPTVAATTPTSGATGVSTAASAIATFSEALNAATVSGTTFQLTGPGNTLVPATVTYSAANTTATLVPNAALATNTIYTAKVVGGASGVKDTAGNALAADSSWTFTTAAAATPCTSTPCSIWSAASVPANPAISDPSSYELGVKFRSDITGFITGIRFYKGTGNTGTHIGNLWTSGGQQLATATFSGESASGWQQVLFTSPVAITANTTYIASYHTDSGVFAEDDDFFTSAAVINAPLRALQNGTDGPNGVYRAGVTGFPDQTFASANYWVDVLFISNVGPDTTPPTVTATTPVNGAIGVTTGSSVTATFGEALNAATVSGTTFELRNPSSALVAATVTYSSASNTATLVPSAALAINTTYTAKIIGGTNGVKDAAGNALAADLAWTFTTAGASPCAAPANPIVAENCLAGNPASEWDISGVGDSTIQGFATDISINRGSTVTFKVKSTASNYRIDIYRMGYYGGSGARKIATVLPSVALPQTQPNCLLDSGTRLVDCGNWAVSASWAVPANATSGIYIAKLVRTDTNGASHMVFIVRDDASQSKLLFQTSDTTWQAYNNYGGYSLYGTSTSEFDQNSRAYKVSYNRPFATRGMENGISWVFNSEYPMVRWLESNGYDVSYFTGVDAARFGSLIRNHSVYLPVGHDEYWANVQRTNVEAARNAGVNLAFFTGNGMFWKTRWENSSDGSNTAYRTLVTYKETHANAKIDPNAEWTGTWRDPRFSPPSDGNRPENALMGTIFTINGPRIPADSMQVPAADGKMRFWRNTNIATQTTGQTVTLPAGTLGFEWDEDLDNGFRPTGLVRMSSTTVNISSDYLLDYGSNYGPGVATHSLTLYRHSSGALVFGAGTIQWSWGLDANHDHANYAAPAADSRMQQATVNLFADMGAQPATLQSGLVPAAASTDTTAPTSVITAPANGASVQLNTPVSITGTATDTGGVVGGVEVSVDGGASWHPANGRATWTYSWTPIANGTAIIKSRAADDSGRVETPSAGNTITVGATDTNPPTVTANTPANAATGVATGSSVTATFSEAINPTTISGTTFELRGPGTTLVAATVTYDAPSRTATLVPNAALALNTVYNATVKGGTTDPRVKDLAGNALAANLAWSFTTTTGSAPVTLVGDTTIRVNTDQNSAGSAEAFQYTATASGTANKLYIYIDSDSSATQVVVGVYTNTAGNAPGTLLAQATLSNPTEGAWNSVAIPSANISNGTPYWIAVLGPVGAGTVQFRDVFGGGGRAQLSSQSNLTTLPASWSAGSSFTDGPMSAYVVQEGVAPPTDSTPPTVAMTAPANAATVAGATVTVSANASDNVAVTSVQFLLDGAALGTADTSAPYSITWNSSTATNGAHTLSARAADAAGNTTTATNVAVTVSNLDTTAPAAPTALTATGSATGIALDWANNAEADLAGYNVYRAALAAGPFTKLNAAVLTTSAYNDTAAPGGVVSYYRVTAVDTATNESTPATANATRPDTTAPAAPTGLTAAATTSGITLDWANNAEADLAGYNVYRATSAGGTYTKINAAVLTASVYEDTLAPTGTSFYQVAAVDLAGNLSARSATVSAALTKTNRAPNPGFELVTGSNPSSWTSSTSFTRSDVVARSGTYSGRNNATNNASYTLTSSSITGLSAATAYNFTGWVNIPSTSDAFTFSLQVRWRNLLNGTIRTDTVATYNAATGGWVKATANLTSPATTNNAVLIMTVTSLNATIYVDDFALR